MALSIICDSPPGGIVGVGYIHTFPASGGTEPYTFAITAGAIPDGTALDPATGIVSGTPSLAGTFSFTVEVTDSDATTADVPCSIAVIDPLTITCGSPPDAVIGQPYAHTFPAAGGTPPYTFAISVGTLPAGLTLNTLTGVVSGTPTQSGAAGFTIQVTDSAALVATAACAITVEIQASLWLADFFSSTDGWVFLPTDGIPIQYNVWRYWPIDNPSADYQVGELVMEMANPVRAVTADIFYNYNYLQGAPDQSVLVPAGAQALRGRYFSVLNNNILAGVVQYSIGLRLHGASGDGAETQFFFFEWRDFPWTAASDDGLPQEFSWIEIDVNTNGIPIPMEFQLDGQNIYSFNVSGTFFNRASTITLPLGQWGTQWRIVPTATYSGVVQVIDTIVIWTSGYQFSATWVGQAITITGVVYTIASVESPTHMHITPGGGVQLIAGYSLPVSGPAIQLYKLIPHVYPWNTSPDGLPVEFGWLDIKINTNGQPVAMLFQVDGATAFGPFNVSGTFDNRSNTVTLPVAPGITGTQWRIVPADAGYTGLIQIFNAAANPYPWNTSKDGQPVEFGWLDLELNTNGIAVPFLFEVRGVAGITDYPFTATGTYDDRSFTITLPLGLTGIQWRIVPSTPGYTGVVQIFKAEAKDYPWQNFSSDLPKEYSWLEVQVNTNGASVPFALQIDGTTAYAGPDGTGFSLAGTYFNPTNTVTLPQGLTGIQWRIVPFVAGYTGTVQIFSVIPRDFAWSDSDYGCPKTFGWLEIEINTEGATVPFQFQWDGGGAGHSFDFNVTGTFFNRSNIITLPSNITGTLWRVTPTAVNYRGMLQLFSATPKFEKLPCPLTHFDTLGQVFGSAGWRFIYQIWLDYQSQGQLVFSIYRDNDVLFFQQTLPAHPARAVERFYLPPVNQPAGATVPVFNKSQLYEFVLDSILGAPCVPFTPPPGPPGPSVTCAIVICPVTNTFQLYRDGSRVEIRPLYEDQRAGFEQKTIWELIPLAGI